MPVSTVSLEYLAGFFDGEGSVGIYADGKHLNGEPKYKLQVTVSQSGHERPLILELFHDRFGGSITRQLCKDRPVPAWHWRVGHGPAADCLRIIEPYVIGKRPQVLVALAFAELVREAKHLPRRGPDAIDGTRKRELIAQRADYAVQIKELKRA
jgi:hypothetical protein